MIHELTARHAKALGKGNNFFIDNHIIQFRAMVINEIYTYTYKHLLISLPVVNLKAGFDVEH